jgi:hypothetical protein
MKVISIGVLLFTAASILALARTAPAQNPELLITMGPLSVSEGIAEQALAVKNNSRRLIKVLWIGCEFLTDKGILLSAGLASLTNLRPGDIRYVSPKGPHGQSATRTICSVSSVRY